MNRLVYTLAAIGLAASVAAQEPTPTETETPTPTATDTPTPTATPCPALSRQVTDTATGQTRIECYDDASTLSSEQAAERDAQAAALAQQEEAERAALRVVPTTRPTREQVRQALAILDALPADPATWTATQQRQGIGAMRILSLAYAHVIRRQMAGQDPPTPTP